MSTYSVEDHHSYCPCRDGGECVCEDDEDDEECVYCAGDGAPVEDGYTVCHHCNGTGRVCWCRHGCRCRERPSLLP